MLPTDSNLNSIEFCKYFITDPDIKCRFEQLIQENYELRSELNKKEDSFQEVYWLKEDYVEQIYWLKQKIEDLEFEIHLKEKEIKRLNDIIDCKFIL